jgi:GTP:adenosylcobinamide-phosphate guanylyltransferase
MKLDAILPAGGRVSTHFAEEAQAYIKALITIGGETLLGWSLNALRGAGLVNRIVVIGPDEINCHSAAKLADCVLPEGDSGPENIFRGLEWLRQENGGGHADRALILTTDLPFITSRAITGFVQSCPSDADLCTPLYRRQEYESQFPGSRSAFVKLQDGEWTTGCAFLVNPEQVSRNRIHLERAFAARKSQLAMARLLGPLFIARFLTRTLRVQHIEERCARFLGCHGVGVMGCDPALAFDIDSEEDYRYAMRHVETTLLNSSVQEIA